MTDLSKLAAGLSEAQRKIIERFDTKNDVVFVNTAQLPEAEKLLQLDIVTQIKATGLMFIALKPLGKSLAAYLKDTNHG